MKKKTIFVLTMVLSSLVGVSFACADYDDTVSAHWACDSIAGGMAADSSGNGNDGLLTDVTLVEGVFGSAYSFNGTSSYIDMGDPADNDLDFWVHDFSILFWIKTSWTQGFSSIIEKDVANLRLQIQVTPEGKLRVIVGTTAPITEGNIDICDGEWNHVAVIRKDGVVTSIVNGLLDANGTASGSTSNDEHFYIGTQGGNSFFADIDLDDILTLKTRALGETEITAIMTDSVAGFYGMIPEPGSIIYVIVSACIVLRKRFF